MESGRRYDILRKNSEEAVIFLEGVADLSAAESRVKELLSFWPGDYQIFDLQTKQVVFNTELAVAELSDAELSAAIAAPAHK
jgi:hypothetical protein